MATHGPSDAAPSAKQLVFRAMLATVVAVIVFLCGVLVGRGVPARRVDGRAATEAAPGGAGTLGFGVPEIAPDPEAESGSPLDALSYFDRLTSVDPAPETLAAAGSWVVQVAALRSGDDARTVADGLVARGYPAFVVPPASGAPAAVYRVRVGPYADHGEADTVRDRLETEEHFEPWVVPP